jgi:hypothetical protein
MLALHHFTNCQTCDEGDPMLSGGINRLLYFKQGFKFGITFEDTEIGPVTSAAAWHTAIEKGFVSLSPEIKAEKPEAETNTFDKSACAPESPVMITHTLTLESFFVDEDGKAQAFWDDTIQRGKCFGFAYLGCDGKIYGLFKNEGSGVTLPGFTSWSWTSAPILMIPNNSEPSRFTATKSWRFFGNIPSLEVEGLDLCTEQEGS